MLRRAFRLLGPAVFLTILATADLRPTFAALNTLPLPTVTAGYLLFLPQLMLRSMRWRLLVHDQGHRMGVLESVSAYAFSILMGTVTPGRLGEFIKVAHLRAQGQPYSKAAVSVIADRVLDILILVVLCAVGGPLLLGVPGAILGAAALGMACTTVGAYLALRSRRLTQSARRVLEPLVARVGRDHFAASGEVLRSLAAIRWRTIVLGLALSAIAWAVNYFAIFLFARGLGITVSFFELSVVAAATSLAVLLPVTVLGVGTRDVMLIGLLGTCGVPSESALSLSVVMLSLLLANALLSAFSLFTPAATLGRYSQSSSER